MNLRIGLVFICALLVFSSCKYFNREDKADAIAVAYDKYLYKSDIQGVVPLGTSPADSLEIVSQYINNWVRRQVILHQAENNLAEDQKDFNAQLETYRNSLIVFEYESELIRQKLDTVVSEDEIQKFYDANPQNFQLRENIVKVNYVKIPQANANSVPAKKASVYLKSGKPQDIEKLDELCQSSMLTCRIDSENWVLFNDLQQEVPLNVDDQESFLRNRKYYETNDSLFVYLIKFSDYKMKETLSPLSLEIENIRNIIINRRKLELINRMEQEVFQKALENKEFEIF